MQQTALLQIFSSLSKERGEGRFCMQSSLQLRREN